MKIDSNKSYLRDAGVAQLMDGTPLRAGCPTRAGAFAPEGEWMIAVRDFHLDGGWGGGWEDPGADIKAGQKFRLLRRGNPAEAAIWEVADLSNE